MVLVVLMLESMVVNLIYRKLFHLYKPNYDRHSAITGKQNDDRNPTLSSNSWGYRSSTWQTVVTIGIDQQ